MYANTVYNISKSIILAKRIPYITNFLKEGNEGLKRVKKHEKRLLDVALIIFYLF